MSKEERQRRRDYFSGRYEKYSRCEGCAKPVGEDDYFSEPKTQTARDDTWGLVLCGRCAGKLEDMTAEEGLRFLERPASLRGREDRRRVAERLGID